MREIALIVICVLAAVGVQAQSHSFSDTILVKYEQFNFDDWVAANQLNHGKVFKSAPMFPGSTTVFGYDDLLQYNYTNNPAGVEVVGLSAVINLSASGLLANAPEEYLLMYEATPDSFPLRARVQWQETDTAGRPIESFLSNWIYNCESLSNGLGKNYYRVFDYYFDEPIVMYDSFYVGGTCYGAMGLYTPANLPISYCNYVTVSPTYDDTCYTVALWKLYPYTSHGILSANQWYWIPSNQFLMVLPIIKVVDTTFAHAPECPRVSGLFARGSYTDTVTVQWAQDSLHTEFELSYGREGIAAEDGTIVTVNGNRWQFTDTAYNDIPMVAYVRTVCREYDTLRWSGWSSVRWRLHHEVADTSHSDTTQHEGIVVPEEGDDLTRYVRLMPNPASGNVVVMSSYGIESVEVYDVRGERVAELTGVGRERTAGFDVSRWAKGAYVVLVRTPMGTASKRLVVN